MERSVLFLLVASTTACSEYDLAQTEGPSDPGPLCADAAPDDYAAPLADSCRVEPEIGSFEPVVEWHWTDNPVHPGFDQVMAQPVVANLTDDDGDGDIDEEDMPDVLFTAFSGGAYMEVGAITALSGTDGRTLWSVRDAGGHQPYASSGIAVADLDGDGDPEVLVSTPTGLLCLDHAGRFAWHAAVESSAYGMPAVGDLDGDGSAEVVYGRTAIGASGDVLWTGTGGIGSHRSSFPVDLDGDGLEEVVAGNTVYEHDGTIRWQAAVGDGWTAVADLDGDGSPEVIGVLSGLVWALDGDGNPIWQTALPDTRGGPPTVADFDGDGAPEVGVASRSAYRVFDTDGTLLWENVTVDYSSSITGSSVFDFEGDGAAEVVYADEHTLWIYDGATGAVEMRWDEHSSGTLIEYPVIVDVDRDGSAEVVVASNDYAFPGSRGITVVGDATSSWAPARPVWNQHAYSITNIGDDNRVPAHPVANWTRWNSFRAGNSETAVGYAQPDLRVEAPLVCRDECPADRIVAWLPLENGGETLAEDVYVSVYAVDEDGESLIETREVGRMERGDGVWIGPITVYRLEFGTRGLRVRVDDDGADGAGVAECDEVNNEWWWTAFPCDFGG